MAFRATGYWKSIAGSLGRGKGNRSFASSNSSQANSTYNKYAITGEFAPVYIVFGFVSIAVTIATHTAKQQLFHCPNVSVLKQRRKSMSEVDEPDIAVDSGDKFLSKSFLRKVGNIQEQKRTVPKKAETLNSVGVQPNRN